MVALQPAASPPCSLWQFLGVPQAAQGVGKIASCIRNRLGTLFPGLEATPPVLAITDPANLQSSNPAVSSAASVKADEDAAPQKVKAIKYLGTIGCGGCYPDVQDALLKALDDCTEEVRFEAVKALRNTACGQCKVCRSKACCSPKVMQRLDKVVYDVDNQGCYKEPSPRVRRVARLAMCACGGGVPATAGQPLEGPSEGPAPAPAPAPATARATAAPVVHAALPPNRMAAQSSGAAPAVATVPAKAPPVTPQPAQVVAQPEPAGVVTPAASSTAPLALAEDFDDLPPVDREPGSRAVRASATETIDPPAPASAAKAPLAPAAAAQMATVHAAPSEARVSEAAAAEVPSAPAIEPVADDLAATAPAAAESVSPPVADKATIEAAIETIVKPALPRVEPAAEPLSAATPATRPTQPAAEAPSAPVAVATGIEPVAATQASTSEEQSPPKPSSNQAEVAKADKPLTAQATGKLMIFQTQASAPPQMIRNPYVSEQKAAPKQEIDLLAGGRDSQTQLTNYQQNAPPVSLGSAAPQGQIADRALLDHYQRNRASYRGPAEVRWDWMHVRFDSYATRPDAYAAAATLRQAAVEGDISAVLRNYPRTEVRTFDWTEAERLPSRAIARALLRMKPGEVSVMMENSNGVDVVRLIDT
ncbi:MAG TPA: peptidyl-prolyl cis-trans isomerase, partial [Pirellulales bacterium]|nr:peptidyl-prolyl cis-trans isomerase [Pirellulales bacterium]